MRNTPVFAGQRGEGTYVNIHLHLMEFLQEGQKNLMNISSSRTQVCVGDSSWFFVLFVGTFRFLNNMNILPNQI